MAKLEQIASLMNIDIHLPERKNTQRSIGRKRRSWNPDYSTNNQNSEQDNPIKDKGSINQVYKRGSLNPLINMVYRPLMQKGSIKGCYSPLLLSFKDLRSNPLQLILFLFEITDNQNNQITRRTTLTDISQAIEISKYSARTALRFLLKNHLIERANFKLGKNGWSQYSIKKSLFIEIKDDFQKGANSSSSSYIITKNNTTTQKKEPLSSDWKKLNTEPLSGLGFSTKHLRQLVNKNTAEIVQESLYHFSYGLKYNKKKFDKYDDPLNVIMGVLIRGEGWFETNYQSPKEIAQRKLLEQKKNEHERRDKLANEMLEIAFAEWNEGLSIKEREAFAPKSKKNSLVTPGDQWRQLQAYFTEYLWPKKKVDYLLR